MHVVQEPLEENRGTRLRVSSGEFDGYPPIPQLDLFGLAPEILTPERAAVAAVLAFHPWISDRIEFNWEISSLTAQRISEFFQPAWISVGPIARRNTPIPRGARTVSALCGSTSTEVTGPTVGLGLPNGTLAVSRHGTHIELPTNARPLGELAPSPQGRLSAPLAAFVAYSELLDVSRYVLRIDEGTSLIAVPAIERLLEAVSLGIEVLRDSENADG